MATNNDGRIKREVLDVSIKTFINDYIYRIDLDADYQREKVWSRKNQEDLLDSILRNIDIPKMYLARVTGKENFDFECIDGKQRMATLLNFFKQDPSEDNPLRVKVLEKKYTYSQLRKAFPQVAEDFANFLLTFVVYPETEDEEFLRLIFQRLQLGVRLNSGELLKTHLGTIRDFIYKEMGRSAPFLRNTSLSERRYSRELTLAQICINSFSRSKTGQFVRARYDDLEDFFEANSDVSEDDENLDRIRAVLNLLDKRFGQDAASISSRAIAVSAYLFVETLYIHKRTNIVKDFADFLVALLNQIKRDQKLLARYRPPTNRKVLEEFQKYVSQASVEPYAIKRRQVFLEQAFEHYSNPKTRGEIIGSSEPQGG